MIKPICTYAKWILVGEHSVLRGGKAIAFPLKHYFLAVEHSPLEKHFEVIAALGSTIPSVVFEKTLTYGLKILGRSTLELSGQFRLHSNIPLGSGLGGSASICATVGRIFHQLNWIKANELFEFCRQLEDLYHGKSSGLDIATVLGSHGILFQRQQGFQNLKLQWQPNWYLLHSGISSLTKDDVLRVEQLAQQNPQKFRQIDQQMEQAVSLALEALTTKNENTGLGCLVEAMKMASDCFTQWHLPSETVQVKMAALYKSGALAVKPTGSGSGGYILSLWPPNVTPKTEFELLPVLAEI